MRREKEEGKRRKGNGPAAILVNHINNTIYVVNDGDDTVSVINGKTNQPVINESTKEPIVIPLGDNPGSMQDVPEEMDMDLDTEMVYITNRVAGTISVINGTNNDDTKIGNEIPVRAEPSDIGISRRTDTIYVVNAASDSVSVIDGADDGSEAKLVAGVTFQINPFNSGTVVCDGPSYNNKTVPMGQVIYVEEPGAQCAAKSNEGFEFVSWEENLGDNSTQLLSIPRPDAIWESHELAIANFPQGDASLIMKLLQGDKSVEPEAKLNFARFGTFTANFRELPPTIPPEFLFALLLSIVGSLTAAFFGALFGQRRKEEGKKVENKNVEEKKGFFKQPVRR